MEQYHIYNKDTHNFYNINAVYKKTTHLIISKKDHTLLERDQYFASNLKKSMSHRKYTGAFAREHPQVVPNSIELCIAIARYTLLLDIKKSMNYPAGCITLENIALSSPSATTIGRYVN